MKYCSYCCVYNDCNDYISGPNPDFCGGLNNLVGFKKYFNIFCTNNENNNIIGAEYFVSKENMLNVIFESSMNFFNVNFIQKIIN